MSIFPHIIKDLNSPLSNLPAGLLIGIILGILIHTISYILYTLSPGKPRWLYSNRHLLYLILFIAYLYVGLQYSFFSRPPGSRVSVSLELFSTWGDDARSQAYVIENIIMFVPFGTLTALMFSIIRKNAWLCVLSGMICSISLEVAQLITQRGHCQLDDVVMNTIGTLIGWLIVEICRLYALHKRQI